MSRREDNDSQRALDAFRRIVRELRLSARASESQVGLSAAQLFVLQQLREAGTLSLGELAERTHTDPSSVSVVVRRLGEQKLITRKRALYDERRVEVSITARGRTLLNKAPDLAQDRLVVSLRSLGPLHRRQLAELLEQLVASMGIGDDAAAEMFFEAEVPSPKRGGRNV